MLKSAAAGRDIEFACVGLVPPLRTLPGEAIAPVCDRGLGPSMWPSCAPRGQKVKAASVESAVYSTRLPKISLAEITIWSHPP
jgi:hypothetical protein